MGIAPTAFAPLAEDEGFVSGHVLDNLVGLQVTDQGPAGNLDDEGFSIFSALALAHPIYAVFCNVLAFVPEIHQCREVIVHL